MILTDKELFELTGYHQGARQAKWIKENYGFSPPIRADGHPSVTWNQINAPKIKPYNEPNWGRIAA